MRPIARRERQPLDWASTQHNLGDALKTLGSRQSGTGRLEEAVAAYPAAVEERTRKRMPLHWAKTKNNLGNALLTLGGRESGTTHLEEAIATYDAVLEEGTRETAPLNWADTQNNLGRAKKFWGAVWIKANIIEGWSAVEAAKQVFSSVGNSTYEFYFAARLAEFDRALSRLK